MAIRNRESRTGKLIPEENSHIFNDSRRNNDSGKTMRMILKILSNFIFYLIIAFAIVIVFFMIQNKMSYNSQTILGVRLYIVQSGSMEPAIRTGSLAIVRSIEADSLAVGDVITFKNADSDKLFTHRISEINNSVDSYHFVTKGDANENVDLTPVKSDDIVGKVIFSIPLIGYLLNVAQSKTGLLVLVIIPGVLIIFFELRKIFLYRELSEKKKADNQSGQGENYQAKEM